MSTKEEQGDVDWLKQEVGSPVNDTGSMQVLQCCHDLGGVETCTVLVEADQSLNVEHEVAAVEIFHHEVQVTLSDHIRVVIFIRHNRQRYDRYNNTDNTGM